MIHWNVKSEFHPELSSSVNNALISKFSVHFSLISAKNGVSNSAFDLLPIK